MYILYNVTMLCTYGVSNITVEGGGGKISSDDFNSDPEILPWPFWQEVPTYETFR